MPKLSIRVTFWGGGVIQADCTAIERDVVFVGG